MNSCFDLIYSLHEVKPFESDLVDHLCLISEAFRRNDALANSKVRINLTYRNICKRTSFFFYVEICCYFFNYSCLYLYNYASNFLLICDLSSF